MRRRTLGKGLSELISGEALPQSHAIIDVPLDNITPNPQQPRQHMDEAAMEELTLSIETHGVLQPLIVRTAAEGYELVAGERRWRAARRAGLTSVPCVVHTLSDSDSLQIALIENLQRQDLDPVEAARGYRRLMSDFGLTQDQVSKYIGKSRSAIANTLRLLDLPTHILNSVQEGAISEGHARALLPLSQHPDRQQALWERALADSLTVRDVERLARELLEEPEPSPEPASGPAAAEPRRPDPNLLDVQERLQGALATKVTVRPNAKGGGRIELTYSDEYELERLVELLSLLA